MRIWTLRIWCFSGPGFRSARQVLCGDASRLFFDQFPKHLSSVLGRTELCREVRNPAPQKPQIIRNENKKNSRRLELSISKNTPQGRWGQGPGSVGPRFPAGLPFPVPEILEFVAFGDSGKFFQQFSRNFPGTFLHNSRKDPRNSHSLLEISEKTTTWHCSIVEFLI